MSKWTNVAIPSFANTVGSKDSFSDLAKSFRQSGLMNQLQDQEKRKRRAGETFAQMLQHTDPESIQRAQGQIAQQGLRSGADMSMLSQMMQGHLKGSNEAAESRLGQEEQALINKYLPGQSEAEIALKNAQGKQALGSANQSNAMARAQALKNKYLPEMSEAEIAWKNAQGNQANAMARKADQSTSEASEKAAIAKALQEEARNVTSANHRIYKESGDYYLKQNPNASPEEVESYRQEQVWNYHNGGYKNPFTGKTEYVLDDFSPKAIKSAEGRYMKDINSASDEARKAALHDNALRQQQQKSAQENTINVNTQIDDGFLAYVGVDQATGKFTAMDEDTYKNTKVTDKNMNDQIRDAVGNPEFDTEDLDDDVIAELKNGISAFDSSGPLFQLLVRNATENDKKGKLTPEGIRKQIGVIKEQIRKNKIALPGSGKFGNWQDMNDQRAQEADQKRALMIEEQGKKVLAKQKAKEEELQRREKALLQKGSIPKQMTSEMQDMLRSWGQF